MRIELGIDDASDNTGHLAVAELRLGLSLKLGLRQLDAEHGGQTFAHIVP